MSTVTQSSTSSALSVSATAVTNALEALTKANAITHGNGEVNPQDPQIVSALLHLLQEHQGQNQKQPVEEAAAETLSNLSQSAGPPPAHAIHPQLQESGPSSHPHGPPSLGMPQPPAAPQSQVSPPPQHDQTKPTRRRAGPPVVNGIAMGSEEWSRQRKDNHKEVERRRRGNINEGINELARIVPNGTGEKAKGAILSRSVQYIHHLKENEARNIEKWTLEKLLMDQAMGDLNAQLEDMRRLWQEEVHKREKFETEIASLKAELTLAQSGKRRPADTDSDGESGDMERGQKRTKNNA